ncbi:MAG: tetratricopeptide repeat protein [candidate division WOR-3 bacterium]|nr:tetratricopeptide repeat protein [candidate division WOR-3 bacterium]MCX7756906.1 tetratricopeptide repeat protein [candidate division WOR-3 bacterium]MDW7987851.1 tetratricopeptide repeat protein [candidate division WOR-3 bacterium]
MIQNKKINLISLILFIFSFAFAQQMPLDARLRGGRIHYQGGRYERALEQFELAIKDYPNSGEARFWKGLVLEKLGRYEEASIQFDTAFILDNKWLTEAQKNEDFQFSVFNAFIKAGQYSEQNKNYAQAEKFYMRATDVAPKHLQPYLLLAQMYSTIDSVEKIKSIALKLKEVFPENQQSNVLIALYYFKKASWDSCLKYYDYALQSFKNSYDSIVKLIASELKLTDDKISEEIKKLLKKRNERTLESYLGDSLKAKNKLRLLSRFVEELYTDNMELNAINFRAGIASLQMANSEKNEPKRKENFKRAIGYFKEALKYNPDDYDAQYNLGLTYYQTGEDILAESTFNRLLVITLRSLDKLSDELVSALLKEITPENLSLGYLELSSSELIKNLESEFKNKDKDFYLTGYWLLYYHHFKKSKTLPTVNDRNKIYVSGFGPETVENLLLLLGAAKTNLKKYDEAIDAFNQVLLLNPKNQDAYRNLAVCYREKGDTKKAYEILQEGEKAKKQ